MALQSEYGFNEGSGTTTADSSGNGRNLTASNSSTSWNASGHTLSAGTTEHSGNWGSGSLSAYTVMFWVKRTGTWSGFAAIVGDGVNLYFEVNAGGTPNYRITCFRSSETLTSTALALDTWTHLAFAVTSGGASTIFINGASAGTGSGVGAQNFNVTHYAVGTAAHTGDDSTFVGLIDDLRVFDTALDAATVTTWMNTPVGGTSDYQRPQVFTAVPFVTPWTGPAATPHVLLGDSTATTLVSLADTGTGVDALSVVVTDELQVLPQVWRGVSPGMYQGPRRVPLVLLGDTSGQAAVTLTDTATGDDQLSVAAAVPLADTAVGVDALSVAAAVPMSDTGTGDDQLAVAAAVPLADTGAGDDQLSLVRVDGVQALPQQAWWLVGPGLGPVSVPLPLLGDTSGQFAATLNDAISGDDQLSVAAAVPLADTGTGDDQLSVAAAVPLADTAAADDQLAVVVVAAPSVDMFPEYRPWMLRPGGGPRPLPHVLLGDMSGQFVAALSDTASGSDVLSVAAAIAQADTAAGVDVLSAAAAVPLVETASGLDVLLASVVAAFGDTAVGVDSLSVNTGGDIRGGVYPKPDGSAGGNVFGQGGHSGVGGVYSRSSLSVPGGVT